MPVNKEYIISSGNDIKDICDYFEFYGVNVYDEFRNLKSSKYLFHADKDNYLVFDYLDGEVSKKILSDPEYKEVKLPAYKLQRDAYVMDKATNKIFVVLGRVPVDNIPNYILCGIDSIGDISLGDTTSLIPEDHLVLYEFYPGELVNIKGQPEIYTVTGYTNVGDEPWYYLRDNDPVSQDNLTPYKPKFVTEDNVRIKGTETSGSVYDMKIKDHVMQYLVYAGIKRLGWFNEDELECL